MPARRSQPWPPRPRSPPPRLIHYHFEDKEDLLGSLLSDLVNRFRAGVRDRDESDPLLAYVDGALRLDERADITAARCWVGLFAEAIRNPTLFKRMRSLIDAEIATIQVRSRDPLDAQQAGAVLAFIIGALVLGAFAPQKTAGFAASSLRELVQAMRQSGQ